MEDRRIIQEYNPQLYNLAYEALNDELIPYDGEDYTQYQITKWKELRDELSRLASYPNILQQLTARQPDFVPFSLEELSAFVTEFPFLVWLLFIQASREALNGYALVVAADRLHEFYNIVPQRLPSNLHEIAIERATPTFITKSIIRSIKSIKTAITIRDTVGRAPMLSMDEIISDAKNNILGGAYYEATYRTSLRKHFLEWIDLLEDRTIRLPEELIVYLLSPLKDANSIDFAKAVYTLFASFTLRGMRVAMRKLHSIAHVERLVGDVSIPNVETAETLIDLDVWPGWTWWGANGEHVHLDVLETLLRRGALKHVKGYSPADVFIMILRASIRRPGGEEAMRVLQNYLTDSIRSRIPFLTIYNDLLRAPPSVVDKAVVLNSYEPSISTLQPLSDALERKNEIALFVARALAPDILDTDKNATLLRRALAMEGGEDIAYVLIAKRAYREASTRTAIRTSKVGDKSSLLQAVDNAYV